MKIYISDLSFSYDLHSLTKAFYQSEDVEVSECSGNGAKTTFYYRVETSTGEIREVMVENCGEDRPQFKNKIKREVYITLSELTGKTLPWGTLTGIRPTKLPMSMILDKKSDSEISTFLKDTYLVTDEKIDLSTKIAKKEVGILESLHGDKGYSIYIGIPFCPTTCLYCSFTSNAIAKWRDRVDEYISCLKKEIDYVSEQFADKVIDTVYVGGGTPTTLLPYQIDELMSYVREKLDLSDCREITVEAGRPDSITEEKLIALKKNGVTRISVNPQTMNDETLKLIGRAHSVDEFKKAFALARKYFDNINTDLILGLPGEDEAKVKYTFDEIAKLSPDSVTIHSMAIKRAAHMDEYLKAHPEIKSEITDGMLKLQEECMRSLGMEPYYLYRQKNMTGNYENTGYSLTGKEGIYNILIMEEVQTIVALGAGTVTKRVYEADAVTSGANCGNSSEGKFLSRRIERCDNVKDVALYIDKIDEMIERKRSLFS